MKNNSQISNSGSKEDSGDTNRDTEYRRKSRLGMKGDRLSFRTVGPSRDPLDCGIPSRGNPELEQRPGWNLDSGVTGPWVSLCCN